MQEDIKKKEVQTVMEQAPPKPLQWTVFPFRDQPKAAIILSAFLAFIFVYLYIFWGFFYMLLGILILGGSLWEFFTPVSYIFREDEFYIKTVFTRKFYKWNRYKNFLVDKKGVLLSPFSRRSRLERFRGVSIRFHPDKREEILEFIRKHVEKSS